MVCVYFTGVKRQSDAIRGIRDVEIEHLLTELRLQGTTTNPHNAIFLKKIFKPFS